MRKTSTPEIRKAVAERRAYLAVIAPLQYLGYIEGKVPKLLQAMGAAQLTMVLRTAVAVAPVLYEFLDAAKGSARMPLLRAKAGRPAVEVGKLRARGRPKNDAAVAKGWRKPRASSRRRPE